MAYLFLGMLLSLALTTMLLLHIPVRHLLPSGSLTSRWDGKVSSYCCPCSTHLKTGGGKLPHPAPHAPRPYGGATMGYKEQQKRWLRECTRTPRLSAFNFLRA